MTQWDLTSLQDRVATFTPRRAKHYGPVKTGPSEILYTDHEAVIRDVGNYVGRHELSYSWVIRYSGGRFFKVNLGRPGEVDAR